MAPNTTNDIQEVECTASLNLWNERQAHVNEYGIKNVARKNIVEGITIDHPDQHHRQI